jgi:hypothetical protein
VVIPCVDLVNQTHENRCLFDLIDRVFWRDIACMHTLSLGARVLHSEATGTHSEQPASLLTSNTRDPPSCSNSHHSAISLPMKQLALVPHSTRLLPEHLNNPNFRSGYIPKHPWLRQFINLFLSPQRRLICPPSAFSISLANITAEHHPLPMHQPQPKKA